jgi:hypothetical protein
MRSQICEPQKIYVKYIKGDSRILCDPYDYLKESQVKFGLLVKADRQWDLVVFLVVRKPGLEGVWGSVW